MANEIVSESNIDSLPRTFSTTSLQSATSLRSRRSSIHTLYSLDKNRRSNGVFRKIEIGFQNVFRRFSKKTKQKPLSALEIQILSTITHFNQNEILDWHEKFLADCPNGHMSRKQFISSYTSLCPTGDAERFASHIFRAFDLDKSNSVDFHEFLIGLSMTSTSSSPQTKLEWIFQVFDMDGNGLLTRNECLEAIDIIIRFNYSQKNPEENLTTERLIRSAKRSMMRIFDNNGHGSCHTLTILQFVEGCLKDEFITQLLAPTSTSSGSTLLPQDSQESQDLNTIPVEQDSTEMPKVDS